MATRVWERFPTEQDKALALNLFDMHQKYADVLPLADVLEWLGRWRTERDPASD